MITHQKILQPDEIAIVLADMQLRQHTKNGRLNLVIFRLSCCCGLRAGELCALNIGDVIVDGPCPAITVRRGTTKGKDSYARARDVPLDIDAGTLEDLARWHKARMEATGGQRNEPFVCGQSEGGTLYTRGKRLTEDLVARRWRTSLSILAEGRRRQLSLHKGRHTFISHTIAAGMDLMAVKDMAGHKQLSSTNVYAHLLNQARPKDVFGPATLNASSQPPQARR